jgi:hypothetical protein
MPFSMNSMLGKLSLLPVEQLRVEDTVRDGLVRVLKGAVLDDAFQAADAALQVRFASEEDKLIEARSSVTTLREGTDVTCYEFRLAVVTAWLQCAPNGVQAMGGHEGLARDLQRQMSMFDKTLSFAHAVLDPIRSVANHSPILAGIPSLVYVAVLHALVVYESARSCDWCGEASNVDIVIALAGDMAFVTADAPLVKIIEASLRILADLFCTGVTAETARKNLRDLAESDEGSTTILYRTASEIDSFLGNAAVVAGHAGPRCMAGVDTLKWFYSVQRLACKPGISKTLEVSCYAEKKPREATEYFYTALSNEDLHGATLWHTILTQVGIVLEKIVVLRGPAAVCLTAEALRLYVFCNRVDGTGAMDPIVKDAIEDAIQSRIGSDGKVKTKGRAKRGRAAEPTKRTIQSFL